MKEREGEGKKGGREEDSSLRGLFQGEIMEKRANGEGFMEEEGLVQKQKRTSRFGLGRGRLIHCTGQAQSWRVNCSKKTLNSQGELHVPAPCPWNISHQVPPWLPFYLWSGHRIPC